MSARKAGEIWCEATSIDDTPVKAYHARRGVSYAGEALRWHPACPFGTGRQGCMIALVRNILTNAPQAIHRTALDTTGRKMSHLGSNGRLSLGPTKGGAVKLNDDSEVGTSIGIGEGIETTLSIRKLPGLENMPIWSLLNAGLMSTFPALPGLESVWIAVDHDASGAGQRAALDVIGRMIVAQIEVTTLTPEQTGDDLNASVMRHDQR